MANLEVLSLDNKKVGTENLPELIEKETLRKDILHAIVKWQLACRRRGTHKTKTRAEVRGGGKKPFKQKGNGSARQGSSRSPLLEGGGVTFGPAPRDYSYTIPKKLKQKGLRVALSFLFNNKKLVVIDKFESTGKTNETIKKINKLGFKKAVLIDGKENDLVKRAIRNSTQYRYYTPMGLNVFDLLKYDGVILSKESLSEVYKRCGVEQ